MLAHETALVGVNHPVAQLPDMVNVPVLFAMKLKVGDGLLPDKIVDPEYNIKKPEVYKILLLVLTVDQTKSLSEAL